MFELSRTDITKKTMSPFTVVKYLDVFEHIGTCFLSSSITNPVNSFAFQQPEEAFAREMGWDSKLEELESKREVS